MNEFVKNDTYKELRPANVYDVAANETWLEDLAREGWRLTGFTGWSGIFLRSNPTECRYRMQPLQKKEKAPDPECMELCRELGWEYAATLAGAFHVWRCGDPGAPELDTDPVVQGMGYRHLKWRMLRDGVLSGLLLVGLLALSALIPLFFSTPLWDVLEEYVPGEFFLRQFAGMLFLALIACEVRSMRRLLRFLNAGVPLERPRPYRGQKWLARMCAAAMACLCLLPLVGHGHAIDGDSLAGGWDVYDRGGVPKPGVVYADLRDLEGLAGEPAFMGCRTKIHELAPRMYTVRQYMDLPDGIQAAIHSQYYRLLTAGLARELEQELTQERPGSLGTSPHGALNPTASDVLDGFWWIRSDYDGQYAVARLGRQVLAVQYEGPADLRTADEYFAELLREI